MCQLPLDCIGGLSWSTVNLELASHMTECFDQNLVVPAARCFSVFALASAGSIDLRWGFSVELARAIAMSRPAMSKRSPRAFGSQRVAGLLFLGASADCSRGVYISGNRLKIEMICIPFRQPRHEHPEPPRGAHSIEAILVDCLARACGRPRLCAARPDRPAPRKTSKTGSPRSEPAFALRDRWLRTLT